MEQNYQANNLLGPEYFIKELMELLKNNPDAPSRLIENLMNIDYDIQKKEYQFYKILSTEQRKLLNDLYLKRKHDPVFELQFKQALILTAGVSGVTYGIAKLIEINNK